MHRTQSVDFGIIIEGEIELHLDNGVHTTLKKGAVIVQRGTTHVSYPDWCETVLLIVPKQWVNTSKDYCVMAFILVPSKDKVKVEKTGKVLEPTPYPSY